MKIDKKELTKEVVEYQSTGVASERLGVLLIDICQKKAVEHAVSGSDRFDEMVSDLVLHALEILHKVDTKKNVFAFLWTCLINRQLQAHIREQRLSRMSIDGGSGELSIRDTYGEESRVTRRIKPNPKHAIDHMPHSVTTDKLREFCKEYLVFSSSIVGLSYNLDKISSHNVRVPLSYLTPLWQEFSGNKYIVMALRKQYGLEIRETHIRVKQKRFIILEGVGLKSDPFYRLPFDRYLDSFCECDACIRMSEIKDGYDEYMLDYPDEPYQYYLGVELKKRFPNIRYHWHERHWETSAKRIVTGIAKKNPW